MGTLYLIPDPARLEASCALSDRYRACFEYNDFYMPDLLDDPAALRERIALYRSLGREPGRDTMHGAFFDVIVHSDDPLIRAVGARRVEQSMEVATALGVRGVVFHTGAIATFFSNAYDENWVRANRAFWSDVCARYPGIQVFMENMFDTRYSLMLALAKEMTDVPNFGICLDYSHAGIFGKDPAAWLNALAPYVRHIHVNDHDGRSDLHAPIGTGVTDWALFERAVSGAGIDPSILIETRSLENWEQSAGFLSQNGIFPFDRKGPLKS